MKVFVGQEEFILHPERVLIWPRTRMLLVADLHLGKAQTFRRNGLWLPEQAHDDDLERLGRIILSHGIQHVLFLGDFVHAVQGVTQELIDTFNVWRKDLHPELIFTVVIGNHDRGTVKRWPESWRDMDLVTAVEKDGHRFQHEPPTDEEIRSGIFIWCGHLHPKLQLRLGADQMRLPVFMLAQAYAYLPAFSSLAGGFNIDFRKGSRYYVVAEDEVMEVCP